MGKDLIVYIQHKDDARIKFCPFPGLGTERLVLRKITDEDAEEIFFQRSDKEVLKYIDSNPTSIDEAIQWISMIDRAIANNESLAWALSLTNEPTLIGTIAFGTFRKNITGQRSAMRCVLSFKEAG